MKCNIFTKRGITNIEIYASGSKDVSILSDLFNRNYIEKIFRFKATPKYTAWSSDGSITSIRINNDAYITNKYLKALTGAEAKKQDKFYTWNYNKFLLIKKMGSQYVHVYKNGKLVIDSLKQTVNIVRLNKNIKMQRIGAFKTVGELEERIR